jgi:DNA-3-methyladenine glycosylase I
MSDRSRCAWPGTDPLYISYHDEEWGVPEWDDRALYEKLVLDGFQAGLSWITVLRKRDAFRKAFRGFDPVRVARYGDREMTRLMSDAGLIRNRAKLQAAITNAKAFLAFPQGEFAPFLWSFVGGSTRHNAWQSLDQLPAQSEESQAMSKALRERGFAFVGPTICYAFMQAVGMVNDHLVSCFRYAELTQAEGKPRRPGSRARRPAG